MDKKKVKENKAVTEEVVVKVSAKKSNSIIQMILLKKKLIIIGLAILIGLILIICGISKLFKNDYIKSVKKVLPQKYYSIVCLNTRCNDIAAYKGNKLGKSKVTLLNSTGKVIAKYNDTYDAKAKVVKEPYALGETYFIYKKTNVSTNKVVGYSIANKRGKELYSTEKTLKVLNKFLIVENDTKKGINGNNIYDANGKLIIKNVNNYRAYAEGAIISIETNGTKQVIDEKGKIVLNDYYVATSIYDDNGEAMYLLVEDSKNNGYNYFSLKEKKIIGDNFQNYSKNSDGTVTISKKENNKIVKYTLYKDGKQKLVGETKTQSEISEDLKKIIDSKKYNINLTSVYDENQKYVLVDNVVDKQFGVYDIKKKKFEKLYNYKKDAYSLYSSISKLTSDKNINYYQISCSYNCEKNEFIVFDLDNGKKVYESTDAKNRIQNYYQYTDGYKVVRYSYSSEDKNYSGKYALLDSKDKELVKSSNPIVVVDQELLLGYGSSSSLILYSTKAKKALNSDSNLGSKMTMSEKVYYRYSTKTDNIIINEKGKEVFKIDLSSDLVYSDKLIVFIKDRKLSIFDAATGKTRKYSLKKNEKLNDAAGDIISPYRGAVFINNSANNYIKVLNNKGNLIKKIRKSEIQNVYRTSNDTVVIITKNMSNNTTLYGLYIAK